jgi:hypothetical protein
MRAVPGKALGSRRPSAPNRDSGAHAEQRWAADGEVVRQAVVVSRLLEPFPGATSRPAARSSARRREDPSTRRTCDTGACGRRRCVAQFDSGKERRAGERRHQIHRLQRRVNSPGLVLAPHRAEVRLREVRPSLGGRLSFQDRGQDPGQVSSSVGCVTVRWSEPRFPVVMGVRQFETAPVRSRPGLAMQKVEGSSPFIRFKKNPLRRVFCCQDGLRESQMCPIIWRADVVSTALLRELEDRDVVRSSTPSA